MKRETLIEELERDLWKASPEHLLAVALILGWDIDTCKTLEV